MRLLHWLLGKPLFPAAAHGKESALEAGRAIRPSGQKAGQNNRKTVVDYEEAMRSLEALIGLLPSKDEAPIDGVNEELATHNYLWSMLRLFFAGAHTTIAALNDKNLHAPVAWDQDMGMPSLPSLAADAARCGHILARYRPEIGSRELCALFASFTNWVVFTEFEFECCCGSGTAYGGRLRKFPAKIVLRNTIEQCDGNKLLVRQLIGISASDYDHLCHHYSRFSFFNFREDEKEELEQEARKMIENRSVRLLYGAEHIVDLGGAAHFTKRRFSQRLFQFPSFAEMVRREASKFHEAYGF